MTEGVPLKMSQIKLTTILIYQRDSEHRPIEKSLPLTGIESLFLNQRFPSNGLTFFYGHRCPAIPYFFDHAARHGLGAALIEVHYEIGQWHNSRFELSDDPERSIKNAKFLNLARANRTVTDRMSDMWLQEFGAEKANEENWPKKPTKLPYMFELVRGMEEFSHLDAIGYTIDTEEVGRIQVATVFNLAGITEIVCGTGVLLEGVDITY